jgi:hypothetical protein
MGFVYNASNGGIAQVTFAPRAVKRGVAKLINGRWPVIRVLQAKKRLKQTGGLWHVNY